MTCREVFVYINKYQTEIMSADCVYQRHVNSEVGFYRLMI